MSQPAYIVGIDLGTTNSVLAFSAVEAAENVTPVVGVLEIPQLTAPGVVSRQEILPSCILIPGPDDVAPDALRLPWNAHATLAAGAFARTRGAEIPHRLISSAKSWLCYNLVDRNRAILPWDSPDQNLKLSPVEAIAAILTHLREAWNHVMVDPAFSGSENNQLEHQEIYLTVPASFDAVARELTIQAAESAGLSRVVLLEEPQAAFYAWIESSGDDWRRNVRQGDRVLVCDVGGGTTDFSLIEVSSRDGELALERVAVGDHLLVGGDNMDLALAHSVAARLSQSGTRLNAWQMQGLWHGCRKGKEQLLQGGTESVYPLTILGRGRSLIGGTLRTELAYQDVRRTLLEGFFPACRMGDAPVSGRSAGIRELGLNYEADPAVTRHLAAFISRHSDSHILPNIVLFNGGVMKAGLLRERILEVLSAWNADAGQAPVREMASQDLDRSVARGAVYYGLARRGKGIRIRAGLNRTYYVGVAASLPAVPGLPTPVKALCVAPFGMEEGTHLNLSGREFVLVVGEPVKFDFLGSSVRLQDAAGTLVEDWAGEIEEITTLDTVLEGEAGDVIPVTLEIQATEIGTLELWCVARDDQRRWKLAFNVRSEEEGGRSKEQNNANNLLTPYSSLLTLNREQAPEPATGAS